MKMLLYSDIATLHVLCQYDCISMIRQDTIRLQSLTCGIHVGAYSSARPAIPDVAVCDVGVAGLAEEDDVEAAVHTLPLKIERGVFRNVPVKKRYPHLKPHILFCSIGLTIWYGFPDIRSAI